MGQALKQQIIAEITKQSERDKQTALGPSGVGNPCPHCIARILAGEPEDREFSMYPWLGTAVHYFMEKNTFPDAEHELKLYCGDIRGVGPVKGTTDMLMDGIVVDWKIVGLKKIKAYRASGPPAQYRYQAQIYAKGCALAGKVVESVAIVFIPRDSGNVNDIYVWEEAVQPEMADAAFERVARIKEKLDKDGLDSVPSDDDCFACNMR